MSNYWKERFADDNAFFSDESLFAFLTGSRVSERMNELRKSIHYVRNNWNKRTELFDSFVSVFPSIDKYIVTNKDWLEFPNDKTFDLEKDFPLIKLYTSERGYTSIFNSMNQLLRNADASEKEFHAAALLVEFLNIELYNYINAYPDKSAFEGIIYRGLAVRPAVVDGFKNLFLKPVKERSVGIPLGFMSATKNEKTALEFARRKSTDGRKPLLWKIHVFSLSENLLEIYKSYYPSAIVSSLCSVPIYDLSEYAKEMEVLLRGAFFQILRAYWDEKEKVTVVEACMLNANRDHIKTNELNDTGAQKLFGNLVQLDKMHKCSDLMRNLNLESAFLYDEEAKKAAYNLEEALQACRAEKLNNEKVVLI